MARNTSVGAEVECRLCTVGPLRRRKAVLCEVPASPPLIGLSQTDLRPVVSNGNAGQGCVSIDGNRVGDFLEQGQVIE